jgi:hypothetical protein
MVIREESLQLLWWDPGKEKRARVERVISLINTSKAKCYELPMDKS